MAYKRGTPDLDRQQAVNYIGKNNIAQSRFDECIAPHHERGLQALNVDYLEVLLFQQILSNVICTCKVTEVSQHHMVSQSNLPPNVIGNEHSNTELELSIDYMRPLFGNHPSELPDSNDWMTPMQYEDSDLLPDDFDFESGEEPTIAVPNMVQGADCALCYRTGYVPGYSVYGHQRLLLTTHNIEDIAGYTIDSLQTPHKIRRVDPNNGYVMFKINIPKYFKSMRVSIRDNRTLLPYDALTTLTGVPISQGLVRSMSGSTLEVYVRSEVFTHVSVLFDLGTTLHANFSQQSKSLDWSKFDTLGNINIVLPMTIPDLRSSDLIYVPSRGQTFSITDVPYSRTAKDINLDWSVNTRLVQAQEAAKMIWKHEALPM